jgi:hypothetical protein
MVVTHSLTLVCAASDQDSANAYFDALGWGTPVMSVPLSPTGELPVTHYGAHYATTAEVVATLDAATASTDPVLDVLDRVFQYSAETQTVLFDEALASSEMGTFAGSTLLRYIFNPYE